MHLETVKVQHGDGYMIINKSDFDAMVHKLYEEPKAKEGAKSEKSAALAKDGGKG